MENTYGALNHVNVVNKEDSIRPPPPRPRRSLEKLKKAKEENIYANLSDLSKANDVYDEPVKSYLPPPYPPPPLPPRMTKKLAKGHPTLDRVIESDPEEGEEDYNDEDDEASDLQGGEEIYSQIARPKTSPKIERPPPLPPRLTRQTSDSSSSVSSTSTDKGSITKKLEEVLKSQASLFGNTPSDLRYGVVKPTSGSKSNHNVIVNNNNNHNNNNNTSNINNNNNNDNNNTSCENKKESTTESTGPKKPPRRPLNETAILRPTEQLKDKSGYLLKTGPTRKAYHSRWCLLTKEKFSYYAEEPGESSKEPEARGSIDLSNVVLIGQTLNPPSITTKSSKGIHWRNQSVRKDDSLKCSKSLYFFDIGVSNHAGRLFLFASDNQDDVTDWLESLALRIEPQSRPSLVLYSNYSFCGYIQMKLGISGTWLKSWLVLRNRELTIITDLDSKATNHANSVMSIDLRKVMSICYSSPHQITPCSSSKEPGQPVYLNRNHDTGLYIQGEYKIHTEFLYNHLIKSWTAPVNGTFSDQLLTPSGIPIAIEKCLNFICTYGGVRTKGIYSVPGDETMVKKLIEPLMSNAVWELHIRPEDGYTVHEVASALKQYLKSFSECLLTELMYPEWWDKTCIKSRDKRLRSIKDMLKRLPSINFAILKKLICHIYCIIENTEFNEMHLIKLAPIMGPIIYYSTIKSDSSEESIAVAMDIFGDLVSGFSWLFDVTPEEMEKEREIEKTLKSLRESALILPKPGNDILVGVYMFNREWDQCINVPLSPTMTALELVNYVHAKSNLERPASDLSVFEVVCSGQLERFLHYSEVVMSVILSWTTKWPSEDAASNYLLVKVNDYENILEPYFDQPNSRSGAICLSLFSELKFSDLYSGKVFKKYLFEFLGAKLSIYKDAKASKAIGQWNIEDIVWYLGAETKRNAPNPKLSFTFVERSGKISRNKETHFMVGRAVSCNTTEEYHKWIAGMIISQYPSGFRPVKKLIDLMD